jgi:hypothetical protein
MTFNYQMIFISNLQNVSKYSQNVHILKYVFLTRILSLVFILLALHHFLQHFPSNGTKLGRDNPWNEVIQTEYLYLALIYDNCYFPISV